MTSSALVRGHTSRPDVVVIGKQSGCAGETFNIYGVTPRDESLDPRRERATRRSNRPVSLSIPMIIAIASLAAGAENAGDDRTSARLINA